MLVYRIADPGEGFRMDDLAHSAISNAPDRPLDHAAVREQMGIRAGGFGIFLVRGMVDELLYNEAHNEVVFVKYLD
jgi:anti-sigma regulatory factor (Ser/Thr protein kinase)